MIPLYEEILNKEAQLVKKYVPYEQRYKYILD